MLHDNLEEKRLKNIIEGKIGPHSNNNSACHLCNCTSGTRSYSHFVGDDDDLQDDVANAVASHSPLSADNQVPMRTCCCYGNSDWPYPLKVCEMCIADDLTTGRIRNCGICGIVACDENCGVELVEATDCDEWNNHGCLECRGMESFSEMELFRKRPNPNGDIPRATRICTNCLELFSLFSFGIKYHFKCRYFKCENLLVPSHVVELKRFLKPFPLSLLPEELLDSIVDFLGGKDLFSFGLVCTAMFRKVENQASGIVMAFNHELPTGPTQIVAPSVSDKRNTKRVTCYAEGKNRHPLRAPEDGKTWVGVLNQMEALTRSTYYFDFQIRGGDDGAAMRYLRNRNKLQFDQVYCKSSGQAAITPYFDRSGLSVRGGQVLVTRYKWHHHSSLMEDREDRQHIRSIIFSTDKSLDTGIHRIIVRYYCFCEGEALGAIGILRNQQERDLVGDGITTTTTWAHSCSIICQGRMEEHVFGMEYDADRRTLLLYKKNDRTCKMETTTSEGRTINVPNEGGRLVFAAARSSGSVGSKGNQLSVRACSDEDWAAFLDHKAERNLIPRLRGRSRRGEERLMRYLDHRARRAVAGENNRDNDIAARVEVEHMMDMLMEDEMEGLNNESDSDDEEDNNMNAEDAAQAPPGLIPNLRAVARAVADS